MVGHNYVNIVEIDDLVLRTAVFSLKRIEHLAEPLRVYHSRHHFVVQTMIYSDLHSTSAIFLVDLDQTFAE